MPFVAYPSAADVEALMRSTGYWPTSEAKQAFATIQTQIGAEAAKDEWERLTGWTPFLTNWAAQTRNFYSTDSRGFLDFEGAAQSIATVQRGEAAPLVLNTGYYTDPVNVLEGGYIRGLQLGSYGFGGWEGYGYAPGLHNGLSGGTVPYAVTGVWGRVSEVPGDVYQAILQKAALIVLTQIENLQSIASISEDGFSKAWDVVGILTAKDLAGAGSLGIWGASFTAIASRWKRMT